MWKFWKRKKKQYDGVRVINMGDGSMIEGHEAVAAHFEKEQALLDENGATITFQLFRLDLNAASFDDFQSDKLAEFRVEGNWASGDDTVAMVKDRLRPMLGDKATAADRITLYFNHRLMED